MIQKKIVLSDKERAINMKSFENPPEPNDALKRVFLN